MLTFRFAKTLAHIPHEYTICTPETRDEFWALVRTIQKQGVVEQWNGKPFRYYYNDGFKYWYMGGLGINRTRAVDPEGYFREQIAGARR